MNKRFIFLSGWLLLSAASSMAMSLGRHSGATFIGRPLDISVQAVLDAGDVASLCVEADVFYADNRLDKSRVSVSIERSSAGPSQSVIRVRSAVLVDEPVVTLQVRAGCQQTIERRYVTLSELVPETLANRNTLVPMPAPGTSASAVRPGAVPLPGMAAPGSLAPAPSAAVSVNRDSAPLARPRKPSSSAQPAPINALGSNPSAAAKSRLKVEPLDLLTERDPQLKASPELLSVPAADPRERAAASALWQSLSAQPQDILRENEKLQSLANSVRGLEAQSQKNISAIDELNVKLQKAQSERYANVMVYALAALLLAAMAGLFFLFRNRRLGDDSNANDTPWWRNNEAYVSQQEAWRDSAPALVQDKLATRRGGFSARSKPVDIEVDFDLSQASPQSGSKPPAVPPAFSGSQFSTSKVASGFGPGGDPGRAVKAEELFDVQQQADFFVSIGQHEQAIEVLKRHIAEDSETSALVYLDLFDLYHQLDRPVDYDGLRVSFNQRFNAQVPTFELYKNQDVGLEAYSLALSRIQALWPSSKVLEVIEESLFRQPETGAEAFNLEAYRELLLLYSVVKELIGSESRLSAAPWDVELPDLAGEAVDEDPKNFMPTAIQPLSAVLEKSQASHEHGSSDPTVPSATPPFSVRLGLDIDLTRPFVRNENADVDSTSDARFFAQFDAEATVVMPPLRASAVTRAASTDDPDYLLDFDIDDLPQARPGNSKPPKP